MAGGELTAIIAGLALAGLSWVWRRERDLLLARRRRFLDDVLPMLDACRVSQDGVAYPIATGRWRGIPVRIEPVVDTLSVRKLPGLLVSLTMQVPLPVPGALSVLFRAHNVEFWSPAASLDIVLPAGKAWPAEASLRSDHPAADWDLARIAPTLAELADPRLKELLVTRRGLRATWLLDEATRGSWLVLRQAQFPVDRLPAELVERLLLALEALRERLRAAETAAA